MTIRDLYEKHMANCPKCKADNSPCEVAVRILSAAALVKASQVKIIWKKGEKND